jgi:FkbM family methyltransferase
MPAWFKSFLFAVGLGRPLVWLRRRLDWRRRRDGRDNAGLQRLLTASLRPDSNCIDIGANVGDTLGEITRLAPKGRHYAFEPLPALADALGKRFPSVVVRQVALADWSGQSPFVFVTSNPGYSGLKRRDYPGRQHTETIAVSVDRLDDCLDPDYHPDLVKIDVEGAELGVLRGAAQTLEQHRPLVVFEHGKGASDHYGTEPEDVYDLFSNLGYLIYDLDGQGPYSRSLFRQAFDSGRRWGFYACPGEAEELAQGD